MRFAVLFVAAALALTAAPATAADPGAAAAAAAAETPDTRKCGYFDNIFLFGDPTDCPGDETVPKCDDPRVVKRAKKFVNRANDVYLPLQLKELTLIRELPEVFVNPSPLVRRYCSAQARLSNNEITTAYYSIEEDGGFVGIPWKISVCLLGHDNWRIYDGRCRINRPGLLN